MNGKRAVILESCVETVEEAIVAERNGAHRLELCSALHLDGLTPSESLTEEVLSAVHIPIKVMIRCRPGNFEYSEQELSQMEEQMNVLAKYNVAGFVFGAIADNELDLDSINRLSCAVPGIPMTVHKAIDHTRDPIESARRLLAVGGVDSILTSGGKETAHRGIETINAMWDAVVPNITVIAAGSITPANLPRLQEALKVKAYHGRRIVGDL